MRCTEFFLTGQLSAASFPDWICHRARLLNLTGWVSWSKTGAVRIVVCGPDSLIDAMEMACSLGPADVLVERIDALETTLSKAPNGFHLRGEAPGQLSNS